MAQRAPPAVEAVAYAASSVIGMATTYPLLTLASRQQALRSAADDASCTSSYITGSCTAANVTHAARAQSLRLHAGRLADVNPACLAHHVVRVLPHGTTAACVHACRGACREPSSRHFCTSSPRRGRRRLPARLPAASGRVSQPRRVTPPPLSAFCFAMRGRTSRLPALSTGKEGGEHNMLNSKP